MGDGHLACSWQDVDWLFRLDAGCHTAMPFFRDVGASTGLSGIAVRLSMSMLNRALAGNLEALRHLMDPALPEVLGDCTRAPAKLQRLEDGSIYVGEQGFTSVTVHYVEGVNTMRISSASFRIHNSDLFFDFEDDWEKIKLTVNSHALKFPQEWSNLPWRLSIMSNCSSNELPRVVSVHVGAMPIKIKVFGVSASTGFDMADVFAERFRYNFDLTTESGYSVMPCARGTDLELNISVMLAQAVQEHVAPFLTEESIEWQGRAWTLPGLLNRFTEMEASGLQLQC
ncbi:unnamed protein product [Prorocentrum cordatum]|uniref:Uncharacterized protein n=1 Tax=Prorocentrum cordatum TaxID=2364126 RepID=A0ABN9PQA6_9DINO|nr:unnamed protein product [Polarella glacialis]